MRKTAVASLDWCLQCQPFFSLKRQVYFEEPPGAAESPIRTPFQDSRARARARRRPAKRPVRWGDEDSRNFGAHFKVLI